MKVARKLSRDRQDDAVWDNFTELKNLGFLEGNEVEITGITSGGPNPYTVAHGLGRVPRGFLLVRNVYSLVYWEESSDASQITFAIFGGGSGVERSVKVVVF